MAKGKRRETIGQSSTSPKKRPDVPVAVGASRNESATAPRRFSLRSYLLMNGVFALFCIIVLLFIRFTLDEIKGLYFFFGLLIVGFAAVSVFDYVYDRMAPAETDE